jgi:protein-tyrosine phosphatase
LARIHRRRYTGPVDAFGWFKKRPAAGRSIDLRPRDCHSHVLPGIDDGTRDLAMSIEMLRLLAQDGARTVVCTSHMYPGRYDNTRASLTAAFEQFLRDTASERLGVELVLGAEHFLDDELATRIRAGEVIAFGPERYVLFEAHTGELVPRSLFDAVKTMTDLGYTPLLAHVERYHWLRGDDGDEVLEDLRAAGVKFQVNRTVGKVNVPGEGPRGALLLRLVDRGWIDEVGSDLHRPTAEGRPFK